MAKPGEFQRNKRKKAKNQEIAIIEPKKENHDKQAKLDGWDRVTGWRLEVIEDLNSIREGWKAFAEKQIKDKELSAKELLGLMNVYSRVANVAGTSMDNAARSVFFKPNIEQGEDYDQQLEKQEIKDIARMRAEIETKKDPTGVTE